MHDYSRDEPSETDLNCRDYSEIQHYTWLITSPRISQNEDRECNLEKPDSKGLTHEGILIVSHAPS